MLDSKGFNLWADDYDKSVGLSEENDAYPFAGYKKVLDFIYNRVMEKKGAAVLDIGFGTGVLTNKLYENGCQIYGQDFSERMLELAREKMPEAKLFCGDFSKGLAAELKTQTYDFIIATYSLHHLSDIEKTEFIRSLLPLLEKNGKILIGDVAFQTRREWEECRKECGDSWDSDEFYFIYEELAPRIETKTEFVKMSHCAGVLISGTEAD